MDELLGKDVRNDMEVARGHLFRIEDNESNRCAGWNSLQTLSVRKWSLRGALRKVFKFDAALRELAAASLQGKCAINSATQ